MSVYRKYILENLREGEILQLSFQLRGNTLIVNVSGELDHHYSEYFREKVEEKLLESNVKNLVLDFKGLTFMDSSGIGVIIGRYKNISKLGGKLLIANVKSNIERIFEISGLNKIVPVYKNLEDALKNL